MKNKFHYPPQPLILLQRAPIVTNFLSLVKDGLKDGDTSIHIHSSWVMVFRVGRYVIHLANPLLSLC